MDAIYSSLTFWNTGFVAKIVRKLELDPKPVSGFNDLPEYDYQDTRWRRLVERYPWGVAMYLSDRELGNHATLVAIGELDLTTGKLQRADGISEVITSYVPWYRELAAAISPGADLSGLPSFQAEEEVEELLYPKCLGFYEESLSVCNGGMNKDGHVEESCTWRERCAALQLSCLEKAITIEQFVKPKTPEEIILFTSRLVAKAPEPEVQDPHKPEQYAPPSVRARKRRRRMHDPWKNAMTAEECRALAFDFWDKLLVELELEEASDPDKPEAGECFLTDNRKSRNISGYRAMKDCDVCFVRIWPRRYRRAIYVQLPIPTIHPDLKPYEPYLSSWAAGRWDAVIRDVGKGLSVERVVTLVAKLWSELGIGFKRLPQGDEENE